MPRRIETHLEWDMVMDINGPSKEWLYVTFAVMMNLRGKIQCLSM